MATLLEKYKNRVAVAEAVYTKSHNGRKLDNFKKIVTAKCLDNTSKFLNEAFNNSIGTQRADLGAWKKFCLNLTTVAVPNLIAYDLVKVEPMSSFSGYVTYLDYTVGSNKGGMKQGELLNGVFGMGRTDADRTAYTSQAVVEAHTVAANATEVNIDWTPVLPGTVHISGKVSGSAQTYYDKEGKIYVTGGTTEAGTIDYATGKVTFGNSYKQDAGDVTCTYAYDNVVIPQNDIPVINAELKTIALTAKKRGISIYYSNIAAFQAKTDYGFDLGDQLAEQAVGELSFEIDSEIVNGLAEAAEMQNSLQWSKTLPVGVSKMEHYAGFAEIIEIARAIVYNKTKKFAPNYMVIAADVLPIITFIPGWTAAPASAINGPYFAGTLNTVKVFVSPALDAGEYFLGVNGSDLQTSAAVYAPYMPIVPTQLLGFADGAMNQGFMTLYAFEILSKYTSTADGKEYSPLLVKGKVVA